MYQGDVRLGATLDFKFTTVDANGMPSTLGGVPAIAAYGANSLTEITAGITLTVDFDGRIGMHHIRIVASGANGYAINTDYDVVITAGTVTGTSVVGYVVKSFSIENRVAHATIDPGGITASSFVAGAVDNTAWNVTETVNAAVVTGGITSGSFAAGAVDNAAWNVTETVNATVVPGGIAATAFVAGAIDNAAWNVTENVNAVVVTGGITSGSFTAGAINAAAIATGAIDADAMTTDARTTIADTLLTRTMTEDYATDGSSASLLQMQYMLWSTLSQFIVSGTTITCRRLDGLTTSMTFTMDSSIAPTSRARTT